MIARKVVQKRRGTPIFIYMRRNENPKSFFWLDRHGATNNIKISTPRHRYTSPNIFTHTHTHTPHENIVK